MRIRTMVDEECGEMELRICKRTIDDEVKETEARLHALLDRTISADDEAGRQVSLRPDEVLCFFTEGRRVYALDAARRYTVSMKLYELERELANGCFVRISKSEIVNYKMIKCIDMSITGTIKLVMKNGYETYTSRRRVAGLKELLAEENKR